MTLLNRSRGRRPAAHRPVPMLAGAFTLIELIAVIVVLAILSAVAIPKYINYSGDGASSADVAAIADTNTALRDAFLKHRVDGAPSGQWITAVTQIKDAMHTDALPAGLTIVGANLKDQRGNSYIFTAETLTTPARVDIAVSGGAS